MKAKSAIMLRALLNRYHQGSPGALFSALPEQEASEVLNIDERSQNPEQAIDCLKDSIRRIHFSWLMPAVQQFPQKMQPYVISSLPKQTAAILSRSFQTPSIPGQLAPPARLYLIHELGRKLNFHQVLPPAFLPQTALTPLLTLNKRQLVELIDYLGLYDLAEEIRYIVDKRYLKAIYRCLSIRKQHFLKTCLHQKEKLSSTRLGLERWHGDCRQLEKLLHRRGLVRLAYALCGQHPDFIWHLLHHLDTGRAKIIQKYYSQEEISGVTSALVQQILNLMNFLKKMSEA